MGPPATSLLSLLCFCQESSSASRKFIYAIDSANLLLSFLCFFCLLENHQRSLHAMLLRMHLCAFIQSYLVCVECHFAVVHLEVFRLVCKAFTCDHYSLVFRWLQNFTCDHYWQPHIQLLQSAGQVCVKCCSKAKSHFQLILANPKVKKRLQFFVEFLSFKSITNGY